MLVAEGLVQNTRLLQTMLLIRCHIGMNMDIDIDIDIGIVIGADSDIDTSIRIN